MGLLPDTKKLRVRHAPGMPGTFSPPSGTSDPDMHHGTCVTHVPWCMPGSLTSVFLWSQWRGKTFPAFPAHAQPAILRIWQEAHGWLIRFPRFVRIWLLILAQKLVEVPSLSHSPGELVLKYVWWIWFLNTVLAWSVVLVKPYSSQKS